MMIVSPTTSWGDESWRYSGNTNVWSNMSADAELGYVYLPTSTPTSDYYGGQRPGDNLFAESLVCVDIETGRRVWHYQLVHHGVWDYDSPTAPNLLDIMVDGRSVKAVAQVTKQGFVYAFNRITGEPIWPINEQAVNTETNLEGEILSPTQPIPPSRRPSTTRAQLSTTWSTSHPRSGRWRSTQSMASGWVPCSRHSR